jgi:AraC-like DNA-binding protein
MKKTGKRKFYGDTLTLRQISSQCNEWQFVFIKDTAFVTLATGVFVTDGDLLILRPKEKCSFPDEFTAYKCIAVSDGFIKKTLDLFSPALFDKWMNAESLIISLNGGGEEFFSLLTSAKNAGDGYSRTFIMKQVVVSCVAETIRKDKYGQQALPAVVIDALELMKKPEVLAGSFASFRKKTGMSESNMVRLFARCNLEVPSEVFRKEKFAKARELARKGEALSDIAKQIGYTVKSFVSVYKDYYGVTPISDGAKTKKMEQEIKEIE